ncbi:hypothetical protein Tco_0033000 [Tanacetum coccineum]
MSLERGARSMKGIELCAWIAISQVLNKVLLLLRNIKSVMGFVKLECYLAHSERISALAEVEKGERIEASNFPVQSVMNQYAGATHLHGHKASIGSYWLGFSTFRRRAFRSSSRVVWVLGRAAALAQEGTVFLSIAWFLSGNVVDSLPMAPHNSSHMPTSFPSHQSSGRSSHRVFILSRVERFVPGSTLKAAIVDLNWGAWWSFEWFSLGLLVVGLLGGRLFRWVCGGGWKQVAWGVVYGVAWGWEFWGGGGVGWRCAGWGCGVGFESMAGDGSVVGGDGGGL